LFEYLDILVLERREHTEDKTRREREENGEEKNRKEIRKIPEQKEKQCRAIQPALLRGQQFAWQGVVGH
jgi:hypothetical protein